VTSATRRSNSLIASRFVGGALALAAFGQPANAVILPPAQNRLLLGWTSLGAGTQYTIETSTNLSTWTVATNTTATNVNLSYTGDTGRVFRLQAKNVSLQIAALAWNSSVPSNGVAGYRLYYGQSSGQYTNSIDAGLATTTSVSNLQAGATYYFVATAYSAAGWESAYSNEAVWKTPLKLKIQALP
jgi:hypothetical protein